MEIAEIEKLLESKKDERFKLDKEIRDLKIKRDIKKYPDGICPRCGNGIMYDESDDIFGCRVCSNCNYQM